MKLHIFSKAIVEIDFAKRAFPATAEAGAEVININKKILV